MSFFEAENFMIWERVGVLAHGLLRYFIWELLQPYWWAQEGGQGAERGPLVKGYPISKSPKMVQKLRKGAARNISYLGVPQTLTQ